MFRADLHVHSRHSRATSRDLDIEHLAWWAAVKGITVVATGDCVHPVWLGELKDKLVADGGGLFRLRPDIEAEVARTLPPACKGDVRFMLSTEISTIYKKAGKTRKVHHLIYASEFAAVDVLAAKLGRIGNIASDGRPILGLDSRDLLEIALESGPQSMLVPAHIWTPWFAALGSQSGFDTIAECYGDLAEHIFAVETGLSSDPEMNWRVSFLDRYRLVSSSDAHSPGKLGREATRFRGTADYASIRRALETGEGYGGTVEFFPEEGKYHLDGHRACGVRLDPRETLALGGRCPVCGHPVTVGVAHRVEKLADRHGAASPPPTAGPVQSLVPLGEILGELLACGAGTLAVGHAYDRVIAALGAELSVLGELPVEEIARAAPLLAEAIGRLRAGTVIREAGYDGEYGTIRLFAEGELNRRSKGEWLFDAPRARRKRVSREPSVAAAARVPAPAVVPAASGLRGVLAGLDADQAHAAALVGGAVAVIAGPGSGKTRMLVHRLAHLVVDCGVPAAQCLAVTFSRRATAELRARLAALLGAGGQHCAVHSFHSLGLAILRTHAAALGLPADFRVADEVQRRAALAKALAIAESRAGQLIRAVSVFKRTGETADGDVREARSVLARLGREDGWVDFDDLVVLAVELLERDGAVLTAWRQRFTHILADEFQDIDAWQYRLLTLLAGAAGNLCVIGDPDQAIYGFRGADATCFARFARDFPHARTVRLGRNYRSSGTIVAVSLAIVGRKPDGDAIRPLGDPVTLTAAPSESAEAGFVATTIAALMGGHDMLAASRNRSREHGTGPALGFADFAVLYRTDAQSAALREAFDHAGIPFMKSTPAPLAGHGGVAATLAMLARQADAVRASDLATRLAAANEAARRCGEADAALLAEAKGWLMALAAAGAAEADEGWLVEQVALSTEADFRDARADRVSLLTMHAAKGLEFAVVFVVGLEDGLVPFRFPGAPTDEATAAEERRLFYVAMTRAKERLFLLRSAERFWHGRPRALPPSPFLSDLPPGLTTRGTPLTRRPRARQFSLF